MDFRIGDDFEENGGKKRLSGDTFKIIVIVVVAIIVGLVVFLITNALFGKKPDPVPEITTTTLKVTDSKVVDAYKMVTYGANGKRNELFIKNKDVHAEDFNELQKVYYAMQFATRSDITDTLEKNDKGKKIFTISRSKVKTYMSKFFGPDFTFQEDNSFKLTLPFSEEDKNSVTMKYNADRDGYDIVFEKKDEFKPGVVQPFYGEVVEAKETSNGVLEIKENIIFTKVADKGSDTYDIGIYKDHGLTDEVQLINGVTKASLNEAPIRISSYSGRCGVVTYTFMKNGSSYYYVKSEIK